MGGNRGGKVRKRGLRIRIRRVYDAPSPSSDGKRILVDRLWPRGLSKTNAKLDHWARGVSPSNELRRWYGHEHQKWEEFKRRYFDELDANPQEVAKLREQLGAGAITFLFSSKELVFNNATALKEYLEAR